MRKFNKNIKWIIIVALLIAFFVGIIWITTSTLIPPDKEKMEKYFQQDEENLRVIADYLCSLDYSYVSIDKSCIEEGVMFTGAYTYYQKIEDESVLKALKSILNNRKYKVVGKNYNTVFFQKWSLFERYRGIAVSVNKDDQPLVEFLIKSEPLSESGWYYYEADYEEYSNKWKNIIFRIFTGFVFFGPEVSCGGYPHYHYEDN